MIKIKRLTETATLPSKKTAGAAGYDLYADGDGEIHAGSIARISTGIAMAPPEGVHGLIWPRSGLAAKFGIAVLGGVIDSDYRGEVSVLLANLGNGIFTFTSGDRIAQILFQVTGAEGSVIEELAELNETDRGDGGFGHTGMR